MSFQADSQYTSYVSDDNTNYTQLPFHYLETKPAMFPKDSSIPKSYWQPGMPNNDKLLDAFGIRSNLDYRKYMINNAENVRDYNIKEYKAQFSK
jgi:hypothetical protein